MRLAGHDVIVIGAGVAGLTTAMAMAQRGANVRVFERATALREVGAGIQVGPNGVAVMEALGLRDAAESRASLPRAIEMRDRGSGRQVARIPLGQDCVARYGRPYWHLHRADLLEILADGAEEAGVALHLGSEVASTTPTQGGCRVCLADGTEEEAAIVVGADGLRSRTRGEHFSALSPRYTGNVAWRGVVPASRLPPDFLAGTTTVFMGPKRHIVTYPLRGGELRNLVAVEERPDMVPEGWMQMDDPANLRDAFSGWGEDVRTLLGAVERTFLWGLFDHPPLKTWVSGHLVLAGDACHPTLPFLAQGAAMGLEDGWVLAAELDVAPDIETGLRAYEARRKSRVTKVQSASRRNGTIFHLGPGLRQVAHLGMSAVTGVAPGLLIGAYDWLYGADVVSAQATA
ncbi:FAD-dependent oxidoreductase [Amaricoccus macauensis]|uniref:FAD-dependent oxidoreductase n=1 Tax=Amaricoccus macauensis TaxID=57001 RepID=UPI003C7DD443